MEQTTEKKKDNPGLIPGLAMILLGLLFLVSNFDIIEIGHQWWALFFLIPISFMASDLMQRRKTVGGAQSSQSRGSVIGLITLTTLMVVFLFDMSWGIIWPIFIVIGGLAILISSRR